MFSKRNNLSKLEKKIYSLTEIEIPDITKQPGPTNAEKFLNYLVSQGYLLHGSIQKIPENEKVNCGMNNKVCLTDNGALALLYSLFSKEVPRNYRSMNRNWNSHNLKTSDNFESTFELEKIKPLTSAEFNILASEFAELNCHPAGFVYVCEGKGFEPGYKNEYISNKDVDWLFGLRTTLDMFKGRINLHLVDNAKEVSKVYHGKKIFENGRINFT